MKKNTVKNCVDDLKKLHGLPPYNEPGNVVYMDGIFAKSIDSNYSERVRKLARASLADTFRAAARRGQGEYIPLVFGQRQGEQR